MAIEIIDCDQGSDDWFKARLGTISASNFHKCKAGGEGKVRTRYMRDLAGEILSGLPAENYRNFAMDRGNEMEGAARAAYEKTVFAPVVQVGFVRNPTLIKDAVIGCSPDALVGDDGGLECKSMIPALMIERLEKGATLPSEHKAQVQGCIWVTERKWWDVKIFYTGMPDYVVHVPRDQAYIDTEIKPAIEKFSIDLRELVERIRGMGTR